MIAEPRTSWGKSLTQHALEQEEREQAPDWVKDIFGVGRVPDDVRETIQGSVLHAGDIWLECEIVQPNSTKGRAVTVHIPPEQVLAVLKLCKQAAAEQRAKALPHGG